MKFLYSVACAALLLSSFNAAAREGVTPRIGNQQQQIVQNNGQIKDQYGVLNSTVDARVTGNGLSMFVGDAMLHYQWQQKLDSATSEIYRMDVELLGADKAVKPIFEEPTGYYETYYISSYTQEPIRAEGYNRIVYKQVYKNIDWVLYTGAEGNGVVKYDFIVHPGGNVADIRLKYSGVSNIKLDNGELIAETPYGSVTEQAPYCYEQKSGKAVQSKYKLTANKHEGTGILTFDVSDYEGTLVVDPKLLWATYFGGNGEGGGIVGARDGFAYACGATTTPNLATTGVHKVQITPQEDCYIIKFDDSCKLQWATYYGGAENDFGDDISTDRDGGIYVVGFTHSDTGIITPGAFYTSFNAPISSNSGVGFLAKFNNSGNLVWATYTGNNNTGNDAVVCDKSNNVYIVGATDNQTGMVTANTFLPTATANAAYVAKFTSSGQRIWGTYVYDNNGGADINSIDIDKNNDVLIGGRAYVGSNSASTLGTSGVFQQYPVGGGGPFVAKINGLNGTRIWATYYCFSSGANEVRGIACDDTNQVYAFINNVSTCVANAANPNPAGATLVKFSATGTRLWATNYGGHSYPADLDICPSSGKIYGFGQAYADTDIATLDGFQQTRLNNDGAGFFAEFSPGMGGTRTYGTYLGRGNNVYGHFFGTWGYNISCSRFGIAYITAKTQGTGNFATSNAYQTSAIGSGGNIVAPCLIAVTTDTVVHTRFPFTDTLWCPGDTVKILYKVNTEFLSGNTFTVQLSNASGSFASPVIIGTHSSVTSDTIFCVVPPDMPPGNNYRIRITSTAPARLSLDNDENIRIKANPINFSASSANLACTGDTIKLNSSSTSSGMSWLWTGPGGFTSGAKDTMITPVVTGNAGQYILKGTLNSTGCSLYDTVDITVRPTPDKPVASSNSPVCETFMLQLSSASQTSGVTYSWSGPNAYTSNTQNPVISNAAVLGLSGNYISTVELNGCFNRDTVSVTVKPKPAKPFASAVNSPLCARQTLQLNASTVASTGYSWYGPGGYTANTQNPTRDYMQFNDSGKYYVFATLNGCNSDTDSVRVVVNTDPIVNIFPTPGATICKGEQATFTAIPTNGGTVGYQWYVNGAATGVFTTAYSTTTLNNNDLVYVLMSSNGTCATTFIDTSNYITMNVLPLKGPSVSVAADAGPSLFPNEPINFTATATDAGSSPQYQWRRNGNDISGATGAVWGANANFLNDGDEICVKVTSNYTCPDPDTAISNCIKLNIRLSVSEINGNASIKVYPNPVRDVLHVSADGGVTATLYDVLGRTMTQATWSGNSMNVSMIPPGNYVLKVTDAHGVTGYYKIVKE